MGDRGFHPAPEDCRIALGVSAGEPTLGGIRPAAKRALAWAGAFLLFVALGPVQMEALGLVWPVDLIDDPAFLAHAIALLFASVGLILLGRSRRSRLSTGLLGLALLAVASVALLTSRPLASGLVVLVPLAMQSTAPFMVLAVGLIAAATRWRAGIEGLMRSARIAAALVGLATLAAVAAFSWPSPGGPVAVLWWDGLAAAVSLDVSLDHRRAALTQLVTSSLPLALVAFGAWRSLRRTGTTSSATGWILALPPAILLTLGLKGAATFGDDGYVLLGARTAAVFVAATMTIAFSVSGILEQLFDPLGADCHHPTRLLRDELLYGALLEAGDSAPDFAKALPEYRPIVRRIVRERFAALFSEVAHHHSHLAPYWLVRDDVLRLLWGDVSRPPSEDEPPRAPPPSSPIARWIAKGRRVETMAAIGIVTLAIGATVTARLTTPHAAPWRIVDDTGWALALYRDHLPRIAIAAGQSAPDDHALLDEVTARAVTAADGHPDLAAAIERMGGAARDVRDNARTLRRSGEAINVAAREAGLPFYVDVNVLGNRRRDQWIFYLKTYRIRRTRIARAGDASYAALWVDRLDHTNVVERQLGWTKRDQPRGMVILDVVRDYWRDDLAPALAGGTLSHYARIYEDYAYLLYADLMRALDADPRVDGDSFAALVACIEDGTLTYEGGWRSEPVEILAQRIEPAPMAKREGGAECEDVRRRIEPVIVEVLARKVEVHEVQHVIDGRSLEAPAALRATMAGYSEDAIAFATAELSAYLAEVAHSNLPRLALVHFLAISAQRDRTPEAFAGHVARVALEREGPLDTLLSGSEDEVRAAADRAYAELFGRARITFDLSDLPVGP
jgi:hypothetical protein